MSDAGRKSMTEKAKEGVTPESSKSTTTKMKEGITDMGDKAARGTQPDSSKSSTQEAADKAGREKDHQSESGGVIDSAKNALGMNK